MRRTFVVRRVSGVANARALCNGALEPLKWAPLEALEARLFPSP